MSVSVALVLDADFGDQLHMLAHQMPVWIVSSPVNDRAVHAVRQGIEGARVTTLTSRAQESKEDLLARAVYDIDEHHGETSQVAPYDTLCVYGTKERMTQRLADELGFKVITTTSVGFNAMKQT